MIVATSAIDETLLVTIDRPPVNALDLDAIAALEQVFAVATREVPSGGVVVTGRGQVFSAGVDTRAFAGYSRDQRRAMVRAITQMVAQLLAIPVPVVGAINGQALGREFVLTLACDDCGGHRGCEARDDRRTGRRPLCGGTSRDHAARAFSGTIAALDAHARGSQHASASGVSDHRRALRG